MPFVFTFFKRDCAHQIGTFKNSLNKLQFMALREKFERETPPQPKRKPQPLRGNSLYDPEQDLFLKERLLLATASARNPAPRQGDMSGEHRLIIAIDYGTTFTGEQSSLHYVTLTDIFKRGCFCNSAYFHGGS